MPGPDPSHPGLDPGSPPRHAQPFPCHARPRPGISLREGPLPGPSVHFSPGFFARRSTLWTFGIAEGIPFLLHLKHTHPVLNRLQCLTPCFNYSLNTPLKHTHPVLSRLQSLTPCFNHSLNTPLKHTHPIQTHLLRPAPCFNAGMLPEGKRNPLGPFHGAREGSR